MKSSPRLGLFAISLAVVSAAVAGPSSVVQYDPSDGWTIEGNQPLVAAPVPAPNPTNPYPLGIISPLGPTYPLRVNLRAVMAMKTDANGQLVQKRPPNVSEADAISFVSITPAYLDFTAASERHEVIVAVNVPVGSYAGDYGWLIKGDWPGNIDAGSPINATVLPEISKVNITPTVAIVTPALTPMQVLTYTAGGPPVTFPIKVHGSVAAGGLPINGLGATITGGTYNQSPIAMTFNPVGLGTLDVEGTAVSPPITTAGFYTIAAYASNNAGTTFTDPAFPVRVQVIVNSAPPPPAFCADVEWLPPISLDKVDNGGSTVPIKFSLSCDATNQAFVRDETLVIVMSELNASGTPISSTSYAYGSGYSINGNHYQLNFSTADGAHRYRIALLHPFTAPGSTPQLLGRKEFSTR